MRATIVSIKGEVRSIPEAAPITVNLHLYVPRLKDNSVECELLVDEGSRIGAIRCRSELDPNDLTKKMSFTEIPVSIVRSDGSELGKAYFDELLTIAFKERKLEIGTYFQSRNRLLNVDFAEQTKIFDFGFCFAKNHLYVQPPKRREENDDFFNAVK